MSEITTTDSYFTSTVDDSNLEEIRDSLKSEEPLIGYSHNQLQGTVTVVVDLSDIDTEVLRYIH